MDKTISRSWPILLLLLLTLLTYWPVLLQGRLPGGELSDTVAQGYPFMLFVQQSVRDGHLPVWNPYVFCGVPFYESFSAPLFYPVRGLLMLVGGAEAFVRFTFPIHMLLGGVFAWLFLGALGLGKPSRLVGAVAFGCGAWANTLFYAGHGSKIICWSFFPLLLYACERWLNTKKTWFLGLGGLALGMNGLASHPQMMLYSGGAVLLWLLVRAIQEKGRTWLRALVFLVGVSVLALALAAVQLLPGYYFSRFSTRGADLSLDTAASYSLPPEETLTMVFPRLFGLRHGFPGSSISGVPLYFGRLGLRLSSEFLGVIVAALAAVAMAGWKSRYRWPLLVIAIAALVVSWGGYTPVFGILYRIVPLFRKLRAPHMAAFLTTSGLSLLAAGGFRALREGSVDGRRLRIVLLSAAGLCLLFALLAGPISKALQTGWWDRMGRPGGFGFSAITGKRADMAAHDFLHATVALLFVAGAHFLLRRRRSMAGWISVALVAGMALELVPFNRNFQVYLYEKDISRVPPQADRLRETADGGRVYPGSNGFVPDSVLSVTGYHAAKPEVTQTLMEALPRGGLPAVRQTAASVIQTEEGAVGYEDMLRALQARGDPSIDSLLRVLPPHPLPRVFFADSIMVAEREQTRRVLHTGYDPASITLIESEPGLDVVGGGAGTATLVGEQLDRMRIRTSNNSDGLLVLADTWYPRWRVMVDDSPVHMHRANYWMRAVEVPAGEHTVRFEYDKSLIVTGGTVSVVALALLLAMAAAGIVGRKNESA
ncbi:hypothetical protein GF402_07270 [Candidatus Fermentibacteria bacterium]|nr:hypothetical protein [Candidatus Fermentibacteria bacterium]